MGNDVKTGISANMIEENWFGVVAEAGFRNGLVEPPVSVTREFLKCRLAGTACEHCVHVV
jgi:hypothetical protein